MTHCKYCKQDINRLLYHAANWDAGILTTENPPSLCPVNVVHVFATCHDKDKRVLLRQPILQEGELET